MAIVASGQLTLVDLNDSKQLQAYIGASQPKTVVFNPNNSAYAPNYSTSNQVLTPQLFIAGTPTDVANQALSTKWYYQTNSTGTPVEITASGGGYTLGTGAVKTLTITSNVLASNNSMTYICEMVFQDPDTLFNVTAKSEIELVKVTNGLKGDTGTNAIMAVLTNESHVVATDASGNGGVYTSANTTMMIYNGATDDSANWTVTAGTPVGITGTLSGKTYSVTAMSADTGYVDLTASRAGFSSVTKRFALSKAKGGVAGTSPTTYWLISTVPAIGKSKSGVYTPTSLTVQAKAQTGTGTPTAYSGRFIIADSTNGTTFTDRVTSSTNESTKSYTPTAGISAVRVRLYLAGGTTNLLDEQIIPVVTDGTDGIDSVLATVSTPKGNIIQNNVGSLEATVTVFKGASEVTPNPIKWYIQDINATPASGGDADGGTGWRLLTSTYNEGITGYTSATISIPPDAITGVESFKVVATFEGKKYSDVCTVMDFTDPIQVTVVGTNTFKNGVGTTSLTAKLYQNGSEIDNAGTEYTYSWSLYSSIGVKIPTALGGTGTATGKTITVNASDVDVRANIVCEVSK